MSTTIDHRVVEMRFNNQQFERKTKETLSTLDKLKEKLNFKGASKGLENINTSANKVNMKGLTNALDTVQARFSALDVVGVTALANITNSAVNAGKRIVKALTIDPVNDGWQEYEMTLNAVQTTMAGTGKTAKEVENELKKLDEYADKTVYSTADMLNNLPKFTNAGVELETATTAMIGIANATALAGGDANKASIAFYNLGQAIGTGYLTRMDYNSINNAGIATMEWKEQMVEAAIAAGTLKKVGEDSYKAGNKTLTLQQLFIDGLQEQWATTEVMLKVFGDYGDETTAIGKKAYSAAQDIKTFSQMMESLKATAGTGWKDTWQIVFGGLDEAKEFWTGITNFISGIITGMAKIRNDFLNSFLGRSFTGLLDKINTSTKGINKAVEAVKDYTKVVDDIIGGKWGNGQKRWDALTKAGYDWAHAQNLVNEKLGNSLRRATNYKEAQNGVASSQSKTNELTAEYIEELTKLSDAQLKSKGYTEEQVEALRELQKAAKKTGIPLKDLIKNIDDIDGRWLLINSFKNLGQGLVSIFTSIGKAFRSAFPPATGETMFNLIAGLHKFSTVIRGNIEKNAENLTRTLKGLFAILGFITDIVGGGLKVAFTILKTILSTVFKVFDITTENILEYTAKIGDAIYETRQWLKEHSLLTKTIEAIVPVIIKGVKALKDWIDNNETIQRGLKKVTDTLKSFGSAYTKWLEGLKETDNVPKYILQGLVNGLKNGATFVFEAIIGIGKGLLEAIKKVLGIHSPSTEFFEIGRNIIQGLINGIKNGVAGLWKFMKKIGLKCVEIFKKIDFGKLLAAGIGIGMILVVKRLVDTIQSITSVIDKFAAPFEGLGEMLSGLGSYFEDKGKARKIEAYGNAMKNMGLSILMLAGAVFILSKIKPGTLWATIGAVAALAAVIGVLAFAASKMDKLGDFGKTSLSLMGITSSLFILALAMKKLASIKSSDMNTAIKGLVAMVVGLGILLATMGTLVKGDAAKNANKVGKMLGKFAWALLIMVVVIKLASMLNGETLFKGGSIIVALGLFMAGFIAIAHLAGPSADKAGKMIGKIAFALLTMIAVIKLASILKPEDILKGVAVVTGLGVFFTALMYVSKFAGENAAKAGWMMILMSTSLLMIIAAIKLIASLDGSEITKGLVAVGALTLFFSALTYVSKFAGKEAIKAGTMLILASSALLILAGVIFLLSKMDSKGLGKALGIVTVLEVLFGGLIYVSQYAQGCVKTLTVIIVAITLLIAAVIGLTFIDSTKLVTAAASISMMLGMFALLLASTKLLGGFTMKTVGSLAVMLLVVAGLAAILGTMSKLDVNASLETAKALSTLLLAMSAALVVLGVVGLMGPAAFIGIGALATLIVGIGAVIVAIGALINKFPMLEEFLDKGIPVLEKIGYALGSFFGNIVGGFLGGVSSGLPTMGSNLSLFMDNIKGFIDGAKSIDDSVVSGVGSLSKAIIALSAAKFIAGISSFLSFGPSFEGLGKQLSSFMKNAKGFIDGVKDVDPAIMEGAESLASAIQSITSANFMNGLTSLFAGDSSLADFGTQIGGLGTSLKQFVTNLGTFTEAQVTTVDCAGRAIKSLAESAKLIPNEGGLWGKLAGENSLATFGGYLPGLATNINQFVANLGTFTDAQVTTVECAGRAISALAKAASEIPNEGGLWGLLCGDNSLATFGGQLPGLATNLNGFITNLGFFDESKINTVDCACDAIKSLAKAASEIPNEGGLWAALVGDNSLATFGKQLPGLATNIKDFVGNLGTFTSTQVTTVNSACTAISSIAKLGEIDIKDTGSGLKSFGKNMVKFASKVKDFVDKLTEIGHHKIDTSVSKVENLIEMASDVADTNVKALKTFGDSLKKFAEEGINGYINAFTGETPKKDVVKGVTELTKAAVDNLASDSVINGCSNAGKDFVKGFVIGIDNNKYLARDAGSSVGKAALAAAKESIDSNSPSKETIKLGNFFGQGLVIGIKDYASKVYGSAYSVGEYAKDGLSNAISRVSNLIDSGIDTQPTIRPVLDLSEVESGAGYLNAMFSNGPSVGVMSNLRAISSGMKARNQNEANSDVVSAIDKLRGDIGNIGGTTNNYSIDGVSYDGESDVANAVQTIIRAAIQERRM